jgi:hypothetical protein
MVEVYRAMSALKRSLHRVDVGARLEVIVIGEVAEVRCARST